MATRKELTAVAAERYRISNHAQKTRILDEFVAITGYHRKHAMRMLRGSVGAQTGRRKRRRIYDEAERNALVLLWEASDRVCGKRLKALMPVLIEAMERHGHLELAAEIRTKLLAMSAATIDRALAQIREGLGRRRRRPAAHALRSSIPIRTSADWGDPAPGFVEADLVAHSGPSTRGSFIQTLVLTDIATGWTECAPLIVREQTLYRTRFFGQAVGLCGAPERLVMPSGASVVRASMAVLVDQPFGVVAGGEGADGVSDFVDGLEDTSVHDLLLKGSEQALDDAIGLRLSDEGVARGDAPGADLFLESVRHEVAAVIMAQRQAAGCAGVDAAELVSHRHADGLKSFEAGPALGDMPTEQFGVPVLGDAEQPDLAVLDGDDLGGVGRPHHVRRLGDDPPIVRRLRALSERDGATTGHARA